MDSRPPEQSKQIESLQKPDIEIQAKSIASELHPDRNEDAIFKLSEKKAFGVFDGMGRRAGGNVASTIAREHVEKKLHDLPEGLSLQQTQDFLSSILTEASEEVLRQARANPALSKMGTTASVVKIWEGSQGERKAVIANVGDSRVYIKHANGSLEQITLDDNVIRQEMTEQIINEVQARVLQGKLNNVANLSTLTQRESALYQNRNVITQALGRTNVSPRIHVVDVRVEDKFIVTSDGIHDNLTDAEISKILEQSSSNQNVAESLIESSQKRSRDANHPRSKPDDMSVVIAEISLLNKA